MCFSCSVLFKCTANTVGTLDTGDEHFLKASLKKVAES